MKDFTIEEIKKNSIKYDFGTGVWPVINKNAHIDLNANGEYVNTLDINASDLSELDLSRLKETNLNFSEKNESQIAEQLFSAIPKIKYNPKIGYYSNLYVGYVNEGNYRENGSSGGFGTWIFKELLDQGYIDSVIHVKESYGTDKLFKYDVSNTIEEIIAGSKTRYYPVELSEVLEIVKEVPGNYAVIGLPSFVMDIRLLAELEPIFKERVKFVIGLVCGHQKSTKFSDFLAWQCGIKPGNLKEINYRKKNTDLPSSQYGIEVTGEIEGKIKTVTKNTKDLFGYDWGQAFFKVQASDYTDDVMNETADLTLGDAWLPEYIKDSKGNNILIVRNPIISQLISAAIVQGRVKLDKVTEEDIIASQSAHFRHTQDELAYRLYLKDKNDEWYPKKRIMPNGKIRFDRKIVQKIRKRMSVDVPKHYEEAVKRDDFDYFVKKMKPLVKSYHLIYFVMRVERKILKIIKKNK